MGSLTWHGWQTSLEDVFGTTGILYGGNLRKRPKDDEQKGTNVPSKLHCSIPSSQKPEADEEN